MFEEKEQHEKQQLKEKQEVIDEGVAQHRNNYRQGKNSNTFRQKHKQSFRQNGSINNNNNKYQKRNQCKNNSHNNGNSNNNNNGQYSHTRSQSFRQHSQNYHSSNQLPNSNKKKKKKYNNHYKAAIHHKNFKNSNSNSIVRSLQQHHVQDDPQFLIPSLSEMSVTQNSNEVSYTMMSCQEYYAATSYTNIEQKNATKEERQTIVSLDCEMVGVGELGERSALARVCIINWDYDVLLDTHVKVNEPVTDYRTFVSGIRDADIQSDSAMEYRTCRNMVISILKGKILVGHGLENDLSALRITHPKCDIRDTAHYSHYMTATLVSPIGRKSSQQVSTSSISPYALTPCVIESDCSSIASTSSFSSTGLESNNHSVSVTYPGPMMQLKPRKLKEIAREWLGISIQKNGEEHSPREDAYAALELYKLARVQWEKSIT
jgi:hypothetical protein